MGDIRKGSKRKFRWVKPFLAALKKCGNVAEAARQAGVSESRVYQVLRNDEVDGFRERYDLAMEVALDTLEKMAWDRAEQGSDALLMFLLKGRRKKVFGPPDPPKQAESQTTVQILNVVQGLDIQTLRKLAQAAKARLDGQDGEAV